MVGTVCSSAGAYLEHLGALLERIDCAAVDLLTETLVEVRRADRQVIVFGNGGSAYTASHFVTDLVKTTCIDGERRLRAISLVDNYGLITAVGNDIDYDQTFTYCIEAYARPGDVAIAISASGNSPNVINACEWAKDHGIKLICLTGFDGGRIGEFADLHVNVPSQNYGLIEDVHLSIGHMITQALKARVMAEALLHS